MQAADELIQGAHSQLSSAAMCEACKHLQQAAHHFERLDGGVAAVNAWRTQCICGAQGLCNVKRQVSALHIAPASVADRCLVGRVHRHGMPLRPNYIIGPIELTLYHPRHAMSQSSSEHCSFQELSSVRWAPPACWGMLERGCKKDQDLPTTVFLLEWHNMLGSWPAAWQRHTRRLLITAREL